MFTYEYKYCPYCKYVHRVRHYLEEWYFVCEKTGGIFHEEK